MPQGPPSKAAISSWGSCLCGLEISYNTGRYRGPTWRLAAQIVGHTSHGSFGTLKQLWIKSNPVALNASCPAPAHSKHNGECRPTHQGNGPTPVSIMPAARSEPSGFCCTSSWLNPNCQWLSRTAAHREPSLKRSQCCNPIKRPPGPL